MTRHNFTKPEFVRENIERLAEFRKQRNLTQQELSEGTYITLNLLKAYELGYQMPIRANYNRLAEFFGWQKWEAQS